MARKKIITLGIPCFNEEVNIAKTYKLLKQTIAPLKQYQFIYLFVDNGSTDQTRNEITKLVKKHNDVTGIFLSRNFGAESSGQAIIDFAKGDAMIFYECDMQDPPELIPRFIKKWEEGYNMVIGIRTKTEDPFLMAIARKTFYRIFKKVSDVDIPVDAGSFSLMDKKTINALRSLPEKYRFYRGLRAWIGFKKTYLHYQRRKRQYGKSSYSLSNYINLAIRSFFGFSYLPLNITIYTGFFLLFVSIIFLCVFLVNFLATGKNITSSDTLVFLVIFFGGAQLLAISMIGKYIAVIMEETKNRPQYLVDEIIGKK